MRKISLLGATGSVGQSAVDLLMRAGGPDSFHTVAVTGGANIALLAKTARDLRAEVAVTAFPEKLSDLQAALGGSGIDVAAGSDAICEASSRPADWTLSAIIGAAGLAPGLAALERGGTLALANKESLVCAGGLLKATEQLGDSFILPVDSEHSALFQCLTGENLELIEQVVITASGGAFRNWPLERLQTATVEQASNHPNWNMGQRITIDSASMFNKAMEVIEAHVFFGIEPAKIKVLVHPESIVHAMVTHRDGGTIAHLGPPDMRHAIGYALNWPERKPLPLPILDLAAVGTLNFQTPDEARWPALRLAREVMAAGGASGAVFNAAKEQALDDFIAGRLKFTEMAGRVALALESMAREPDFGRPLSDLSSVLEWDQAARRKAAV